MFILGYLYNEGLLIDQDIDIALTYYKEASSFNNQFAKNNLGILYKNGFDEKIKQNIPLAIEYFNEAIKQKNDYVSMYNLAHIYIFDCSNANDQNKAEDLLIRSAHQNFVPSFELLCLFLIKKHNLN